VTRTLLRSADPVTLIGGGPVDAGQLGGALGLAPVAVAADGGADVALPCGRELSAVIGDMDSATRLAALEARGVPVHRLDEQENVDLVKCLYSVEAPGYLGLGFLGGRIDHHMASMNALVKRHWQKVILLGGEDVCFLCPRDFRIDLPEGARVSLLPMAPMRGLSCEGLRWSVEDMDLAPDSRICVSNRADGGPVTLRFDAAKAIMVLPAGLVEAVTRALWRATRGDVVGPS
jgi:thiamine pyrophosphokinase